MLKHIIRYFIGGVLNRILGLIALPIYTYFLSPEQYGTYALILSYVSLGTIIFTLNTNASVSRFLYETEINKDIFLSTSIVISLLLFFISYFIFQCVDSNIINNLLEIDTNIFGDWIFLLIFFSIMFGFYTQILIPEKKSKEYTRVTVFKTYFIFLVCVVLLTINKSAISLIYANVVVELFAFICVLRFLWRRVGVLISWDSVKYIISYSVYLLPYSLSGIILAQIDRVMLANLVDVNAVGVYSVGYTLSMVPWTIFVIFSKGWTPEYFSYMNEKKYHFLDRDVTYILWISYFIIITLILFLGDFVNIVFGDKYIQVREITPVLLSSVIFIILWQLWGRGISYSKKTIWTSTIGIFSAVVNVALNYYLIPVYGVNGAAYATLLSYVFMALMGYYISKYHLKIYTVSIKKLKVFFTFSISTTVIVFISLDNFYAGMIVKILYLVSVFVLCIRYKSVVSKIMGKIKNK